MFPHARANFTFAFHEGTDVLYGNTIVDDQENELKLIKYAGSAEGLEYSLPFIHQSSLVRKKAYDQYGGYSEKYKICMDYDLFARFYRGGGQSFNLSIQLLVALHMEEHHVVIHFRQLRKMYPLQRNMV